MIYDKITNLATYKEFIPVYQELQTWDFNKLAPGKHELKNGHFLMIFDTELLEEVTFEYHRQYIDVHLPITESEKIAFSTQKLDKVKQDYKASDDAGLGTIKNESEHIIVKPGEFILFFPEEIHAPKLVIDSVKKQRRVVVKIKV